MKEKVNPNNVPAQVRTGVAVLFFFALLAILASIENPMWALMLLVSTVYALIGAFLLMGTRGIRTFALVILWVELITQVYQVMNMAYVSLAYKYPFSGGAMLFALAVAILAGYAVRALSSDVVRDWVNAKAVVEEEKSLKVVKKGKKK